MIAIIGSGLSGIMLAVKLEENNLDYRIYEQGGNYGTWDKDPNDTTQGCVDSFDPDIKIGSRGFSLKLD